MARELDRRHAPLSPVLIALLRAFAIDGVILDVDAVIAREADAAVIAIRLLCPVVLAGPMPRAAATSPVLVDWTLRGLLPAFPGGVAAGHAVALLVSAGQRVAKDAVTAVDCV